MDFITQWFLEPAQNQYADFDGRATREQYWKFFLASIILSILVGILGAILKFELLSTLFMLAILVPSIAIAARRLHDINKSGWWQLIALIPVIGAIALIVLLVKKGDVGANTYGVTLSTPHEVPPQNGVVKESHKSVEEAGAETQSTEYKKE